MSSIFCLVFLALSATQILAFVSNQKCRLSENYLLRLNMQTQRMINQVEYKKKWLQQTCGITLPELQVNSPIGNGSPTGEEGQPPEPTWESGKIPEVPEDVPQKITIAVTYPPGSPCNPNRATWPPNASVFRPAIVSSLDPNSWPTFAPTEYQIPADGKIIIVVECPYQPNPNSAGSPPTFWQVGVPNAGGPYPNPNPSVSIQLPRIPQPNLSWPNGGFKLTTDVSINLSIKDINEDKDAKTVDLVKKYGFPIETHFVVTTDGYKLCLHRIPRPGAPPILLVHGLMSSSAAFVQMGPNHGLAYQLYNQGFDVWLLNTRGNLYSQQHTNTTMSPEDYWRFSFHEIGIYDLPSAIDRILIVTETTQIQYIGHSQGSTAFFVMCSQLPEYNDKVVLMQALSPTVLMENTQSPVLRFLGLFNGKFEVLLNLLGGYKISRENQLIAQFRSHICTGEHASSALCAIFDFVLCGFGWNNFNETLTPLIAGHAAQGASIYQIYHYAQLFSTKKFQSFNLGSLLNVEHTNENQILHYNLTQVRCKVAVQHSKDDWLSTTKDTSDLTVQLPNVIDTWNIKQKGFSHYDYLISNRVNTVTNTRILKNCRKFYRVRRFVG